MGGAGLSGRRFTAEAFSAWLAVRPRVLDGAMASELLRRGIGAAAKLWGVGALIEAPGEVRRLHRGYVAAGADALTAATFRVTPVWLHRAGMADRAAELASRAVALARESAAGAGREVLVLAAQSTVADCYRPDLVPDDDALRREHALTATLLAESGADGLLLETFNTIREAHIAARCAVDTGLPVIVSFVCRAGGVLLSGEDARDAARAVDFPGVVAIGVNCTAMRDHMAALVRVAEGTARPLVAYPNNGWFAEDSPWLAAERVEPERFARCALASVAAGAKLVGGCCGTGPEETAAIATTLGAAYP